MNRTLRRTAALILALVIAFSLTVSALANNGTASGNDTAGGNASGAAQPGAPAATGNISIAAGEATLSTSHIYIPVTIENSSGEDVRISDITNKTDGDVAISWENSSSLNTVPAGGTLEILLMPTYNSYNSGVITNTLVFNFESAAGSQEITKYLNVPVNFGEGTGSGIIEDDSEIVETQDPPFRLSSYDARGEFVASPSGDAGDKVPLRIPLQCLRGDISNVAITPVLSTSLDSFPFDIVALDYTQTLPAQVLRYGTIIEFQYSGLRLSEKVTAGVKKVDFEVSWIENWALTDARQKMTVSVYVNVIDGYEGEEDGSGLDKPVSTPKVILDSYAISTDKIYAGEQFDVTFTLRNTSEQEAVQNIQISLSDTAEVGKLMPANNGSNTLYIAEIGKGETHTETISLQSAPDTEAKAYTLQLDFSYEGASNVTPYTATETIAIPILQRIRLKLDDPVIYDDPWVGQSCAIYFALYNMGKAPIYNCMVDVVGEGLAMEETFFGGTVAAGSTMRADFSIIPSVGGEIAGEIVITYEDVYGEQMEERLPLDLFVNEEIAMDDPGMMFDPETGLPLDDPGMMIEPGIETIGGASGGFPWVWAGVGAAVVIAGVIVLIVLLKKKRAKELEDV